LIGLYTVLFRAGSGKNNCRYGTQSLSPNFLLPFPFPSLLFTPSPFLSPFPDPFVSLRCHMVPSPRSIYRKLNFIHGWGQDKKLATFFSRRSLNTGQNYQINPPKNSPCLLVLLLHTAVMTEDLWGTRLRFGEGSFPLPQRKTAPEAIYLRHGFFDDESTTDEQVRRMVIESP